MFAYFMSTENDKPYAVCRGDQFVHVKGIAHTHTLTSFRWSLLDFDASHLAVYTSYLDAFESVLSVHCMALLCSSFYTSLLSSIFAFHFSALPIVIARSFFISLRK